MKTKIHLLPNLVTAFGLTCGLFIIFKVNMVVPGAIDSKILLQTTGLLFLACIFDLLDGAIARAMNVESSFGGLFDSLSDAISFGVAPSLLVLKSISPTPGSQPSFILTTAALIYTLCGVMRLVRYNVNVAEEKSSGIPIVGKKNFTGLPIPAAATAIVSLNLIFHWPSTRDLFEITPFAKGIILASAMFLIGYFMISKWKFPSFKPLQLKVSSFQWIVLAVLISATTFYGLLHQFPIVLFLLSWGYFSISLFLSVVRKLMGRRVQSLEDFDQDEEDPL